MYIIHTFIYTQIRANIYVYGYTYTNIHMYTGISDQFSDTAYRPFTDAYKYLQANVRNVVTKVSEMAKNIRYT